MGVLQWLVVLSACNLVGEVRAIGEREGTGRRSAPDTTPTGFGEGAVIIAA